MKIFKKMKKGFTLVELVVVIAVIAILAAVSVGAYFGVTESANNSRLEQESKQVYTAIQTVALAPNDHSSLSKDGLVITDDAKFELALEESLGKTVTLLENGNKAANEPTIFFSTTAVSRLGGAEITYKTFEYHIPEISGKKAVADVVTGEVKVESSDVETGTDVPTTTVPDATTETPTIAPTVEPTQAPTTNPSEEPSTSEPAVESKYVIKHSKTTTSGNMTGNNDSSEFGLDSSLFDIKSVKCGSVSNHIGLNKDGTFRFYASKADGDGSEMHIKYNQGTITKIEIEFGTSTSTFTINGSNGNKETSEYQINANTVIIKNTHKGTDSTQLYIKSINVFVI